jgi:hypothetical protein
MPAEGGPETQVLAEPVEAWALAGPALFFATRRRILFMRLVEHRIRRLDLDSGTITEILRREGPFYPQRLSASADGAWLLYGERPVGSAELMLVENLR